MLAFAAALQTTLAVWLVLGQPFYSRYKSEQLKHDHFRNSGTRYGHYARAAVTYLGLLAVTLLSLSLGKHPWSSIGLLAPARAEATIIIIAIAILTVLAVIIWIYHDREFRKAYRESSGHIRDMLPTTGGGRVAFAGVALTTGICEELLYRGFLPFYLVTLFPSVPLWAAAVLAAIFFGLCHWYQGRQGVIQTVVLGLLLAAFYLGTGSLYGPMVLHTLTNLMALGLSWAAASAEQRAA